jgi:integrase/recombinase XerD
MSRQAVWQVLRKWGQVAGISSDVTPRVVRNTSALHMAQSGNTIRNIQRALGHRNPFSTRALLRRLRAEARL